MNYFDTDMITF